ncbi:BCAM0308 family protein [Rhodothermus profundi]|uniref:NMD3 family protein n=1 Tax=Rhodothermus profundi TaxID=633813 RepID=A0A1M6XM67_9BACT|nr:BCAM0308 family protein [Rhodothermus profundi]SHL06885.1 hypothetical protein SAMN04488087_2649 [Rhodothermus profundi]
MYRSSHGRKDRILKQRRQDAYWEHQKWPEPTRCPDCGAVFRHGRWTWEQATDVVHEARCPACRRAADRYPAGYVELKGAFLSAHQEEILNLVRNLEAQEKQARPLERILQLELQNGCCYVTTTGVHLARRIGEALARAYQGKLSFAYADGDRVIRVQWRRD